MIDPVRTLLARVEDAVARRSDWKLGAPGGEQAVRRVEAALGKRPPPGYAAFLERHEGGQLGPDLRLFTVEESLARRDEHERAGGVLGLWPVAQLFRLVCALDTEGPSDAAGEWAVVDIGEHSVDRVATSFLRFLLQMFARLDHTDPIAAARELCMLDPAIADHWLDVAELEERAGRPEEADRALTTGLHAASPAGPALLLAVAMRRLGRGQHEAARAAFEDALALEPWTARDDDARLDAAAVLHLMATEAGDAEAAERARRALGDVAAATAAYWRMEALTALASGDSERADLGLRIVAALLPDDRDLPRLRARAGDGAGRAALGELHAARESLDDGRAEEAVAHARRAVAALADLGLAHAVLAEAESAARGAGAEESAARAVALNPALVEGWRELGDARLERGEVKGAEEAFREVVLRDPSYGLGHAKLAQSLLEQKRLQEALDAIESAAARSGDPFFIAAIRGDIFAEMERHEEAAEAYEQALRVEPGDHWALHQGALEHSSAGNLARALELFEAAVVHDPEGCPQTFIDYADLLRRAGRIGDAVRLYRRAVAAVPGDSEWKQTLREAERELASAPN